MDIGDNQSCELKQIPPSPQNKQKTHKRQPKQTGIWEWALLTGLCRFIHTSNFIEPLKLDHVVNFQVDALKQTKKYFSQNTEVKCETVLILVLNQQF